MTAVDTALRRLVGYNLRRADAAAIAALEQALVAHGLRRVTFSALTVITSHPGLRQAELADGIAVNRANIVVIVSELVAAGLVTRTRTTDDRRAYALAPTPAGRALCDAATAQVLRFDASLTDGLSDAERDTLIRLLRKVEANTAARGTP